MTGHRRLPIDLSDMPVAYRRHSASGLSWVPCAMRRPLPITTVQQVRMDEG